jgi:DnaJ-class molecular chaperone
MPVKNYYAVLEVNRNAISEDIRKGFRRLAIQYHPDHNPENAAEAEAKFKDINEAYSILGDDIKRWQYDHLITLPSDSGNAISAEDIFRRFAGGGFSRSAGSPKFWGNKCNKGWKCRWR